MPYSFPVSPSILFGAPCRVYFTRHGFFSEKKNKNNKKTAMYKLSCSKPQKNENNNDLPYCGMSRKTSRLLFGAY